MKRLSLLIIFGGDSSEHDISIASARNIVHAVNPAKYDTTLAYIDRSGRWWYLRTWLNDPTKHDNIQLVVAPGTAHLLTIPGSKTIKIDVMFPVLHGKHGEDGSVQGLADMLNVPVVGPSIINAAITMDKDITKRLLRDSGVPVVDWQIWHTNQPTPHYDAVVRKLGKTIFIKPSNAGSSVGVSKVRTKEEYDKALLEAARHDTIILIERAAEGIEVQLAVMGGSSPEITQLCEIESSTDFHDFEDKYDPESSAKFHVPARLGKKQTERLIEYALTAYDSVRGQGLARIDFFVVNKKTEYLNEINSIPGFTDVSVYPMLWQKSGLETSQLIDQLIMLATD